MAVTKQKKPALTLKDAKRELTATRRDLAKANAKLEAQQVKASILADRSAEKLKLVKEAFKTKLAKIQEQLSAQTGSTHLRTSKLRAAHQKEMKLVKRELRSRITDLMKKYDTAQKRIANQSSEPQKVRKRTSAEPTQRELKLGRLLSEAEARNRELREDLLLANRRLVGASSRLKASR